MVKSKASLTITPLLEDLKMPQNGPEKAVFDQLRQHQRLWKGYPVPGHQITELAEYCRVSRKTIYNWLNGKTKPKAAKLRLVQEWLDSRPKGEFEE